MSKFRNLTILAMLAFSISAHCGIKEGGGGRAVVCRSSATGEILSAKMFDLFEGDVQFGWSALTDARTYNLQLADAIHRVGEGREGLFRVPYAAELRIDSEVTFSKFKLVDAALTPVNDSFEAIAPRGCQIEQLANNLEYTILVDKEIWQHLDETSKAALILHETVYSELRDSGETDSIRTRRVVALAFSGHKFQSIRNSLPAFFAVCETKNLSSLRQGSLVAALYLDPKSPYFIQMQVLYPDGHFQFEASPIPMIQVAKISDFKDPFFRVVGTFIQATGHSINNNIDLGGDNVALRLEKSDDGRYKAWMQFYPRGKLAPILMPEPTLNADDRLHCVPSDSSGISSKDWDSKFLIDGTSP